LYRHPPPCSSSPTRRSSDLSSRAPHMRAGRPRPPPPAPSRSIASPPPHVSGQGFHCLMVKPPDPREASQTGSAAPLGGSATPHSDRKSTRLNSSHEWISYAV